MAGKIIEGDLSAKKLRFAIIVGRFNSFVTDRLLSGALDALTRSGCPEENVEIVKVPGAWEMPVVARELARGKRCDAIIALGAVIRGGTPHFDDVAGEKLEPGTAAMRKENPRAKGKRQGDPSCAFDCRCAQSDDMRAPVKQSQIEQQYQSDAGVKGNPEWPGAHLGHALV
jgi:6,7-dimethyl-8-ribityllumazine synthase